MTEPTAAERKLADIGERIRMLQVWADDRWDAEVASRPVENVHRRCLDETWKQVQRKLADFADATIGHAAAPDPRSFQPTGNQVLVRLRRNISPVTEASRWERVIEGDVIAVGPGTSGGFYPNPDYVPIPVREDADPGFYTLSQRMAMADRPPLLEPRWRMSCQVGDVVIAKGGVAINNEILLYVDHEILATITEGK